ncbi:MAG TPA: hypothetical protein PK496_09910, partial [Bacteroidales bacterium]|nr:hypothetical protein [Bacteroidales bacterium]
MQIVQKSILIVFFSALGLYAVYSQNPAEGRSWQYVATSMPEEWYGTDESLRVAENVLLYQRDAGGWPKNIRMHLPLTEPEKARIKDEKGLND